jgi:predicted AAA+ superfamily ATPase
MLVGPRQVGKTTLIKTFLDSEDYLFLDGDDPQVRDLLLAPNTQQIRSIIGESKIVFVDEAQRINGIGLTAKIITDQFKDVQLWISGSSSFELSHQLNEPLTGRKWLYELYPITWSEYEQKHGYLQAAQSLEVRLKYGWYPDVLNNPGDEVEILKNLVDSYLYRDILSYAEIRKPELLEKIVKALALQLGSEVNTNELAQLVGVDKNTINRYLDILEKGYVIYQLPSYSRNIRNELKKSKKIYFYDIGVRNTIIGNFKAMSMRQDIGGLWENFLISERRKQNAYHQPMVTPHFWRTTQQQEIDYIEESSDGLRAFEFKWSPTSKAKFSKTFTGNYDAECFVVNRDNYRDFIAPDL